MEVTKREVVKQVYENYVCIQVGTLVTVRNSSLKENKIKLAIHNSTILYKMRECTFCKIHFSIIIMNESCSSGNNGNMAKSI